MSTVNLEQRIRDFSNDTEIAFELLAMLKVGVEKGDSLERVMAHLICSTLLRFHKIPAKPGQS